MRAEYSVSRDGGADFRTIGEAMRAAGDRGGAVDGQAWAGAEPKVALPGPRRIRIRIAAGVYREKLRLMLPDVELVGAGHEKTRIVWDDCATRLLPNGERMGTFNSYTVYVGAPRVSLRGLSIENAAGDGRLAGQAVALYADADLLLVEDCRLSARQDTLCTGPLPKNPPPKGANLCHPVAGLGQDEPALPFRQLYRRCLIEGDVDFVFGSALAVFEGCDLRSLARPPLDAGAGAAPRREAGGGPGAAAPPAEDSGAQGWIAAPSTYPGQAVGFVFLDCKLSPGPGAAQVYLGRPWRHTGRAAFIRCRLGPHILPEGWDDWGKPEARAYGGFGEFGSTGPGAPRRTAGRGSQRAAEGPPGPRAPWARALSEAEAAALSPEALFDRAFAGRHGSPDP